MKATTAQLRTAIEAIPEEYRLDTIKDAMDNIRGYHPAALDEGMGRHPTNDAVREFIAAEGHHPEILPDIIMGGIDRALVREPDRSGYFKLVKEGKRWYCGCGVPGCIHKRALHANGRA